MTLPPVAPEAARILRPERSRHVSVLAEAVFGVRSTDGQAADESEEAEVEEGEAGMTEDEEETDAGYIEAAVDGDELE